MRLLITGANGFLARRAAAYYSAVHEVTALGRSRMDFTDNESVKRWFDKVRPQAVLHCGAVSDTGACAADPELSYRINVAGSENIARACRQFGARLVFCSSDQVYVGSSLKEAHREVEILSPPHPYGRQKLLAEQLCARHQPDTVSLRLSWMYASDTDREREHGNLMTNLKDAVLLGKPVSYPVYDFRSITDVWEVVKNLEAAWSLPPGVYNFGSPNSKSTYELAKRMIQAIGGPEDLVFPDTQAFSGNPRNLRMDMRKAEEAGVRFLTSEEGLRLAGNKLKF